MYTDVSQSCGSKYPCTKWLHMSSAYFRCMLSRFILIYSYKALDERFTQKMDEVTKLIRHALAVREDTGGHCGIRFGVAATLQWSMARRLATSLLHGIFIRPAQLCCSFFAYDSVTSSPARNYKFTGLGSAQ